MRQVPVVAVPARNEEQRLPELIKALGRQTVASVANPLNVVIVLNNTTDRSRETVLEAMDAVSTLKIDLVDVEYPPHLAHVGSARRLAMDRAANLIGLAGAGVILTTDADGTPHPDWVEQNLVAIAAGADLVGGKIFGDPEEEAALGAGFVGRASDIAAYSRLCDYLTALIDPIQHDPWPRHQDHTGASLAVRADVYRSVGGLPALPFREDLGFVERVVAQGYRLSHPETVKVTVSARLQGRAPGGMADCIASWVQAEADHLPVMVENPTRVEQRALRRQSIRQLLGRPRADWIATLAQLDAPQDLRGRIALSRAGIAELIQACAPPDPDALADTPILQAMTQIQQRIAQLERNTDAA